MKQRTWFITGASKGLGMALVERLLKDGEQVAATSRSTTAFVALQRQYPGILLALEVDLTLADNVKLAIEQTIAHFGRLDIAVNNAGYSLVGSMEEVSDKEFRDTIDVNLFGTANVIRSAMIYFRQQASGYFINISSNAGYIGFANAATYNAAKFAVIGLSEALAEETKAFGIKVTVVAPGQFRTNFMDSLQYAENKIDVYKLAEAENMWKQYSGTQRGNPDKLVQILIDLANNPEPPLHLLAGPDTYELVMAHRATEAKEIATWKEVTLSTDFDE